MPLTTDHLAEIKARRQAMKQHGYIMPDCSEEYAIAKQAGIDIDSLIAELESVWPVVGLALEYAYDKSYCNGCGCKGGDTHDKRCPVAAIEKLSGEEN